MLIQISWQKMKCHICPKNICKILVPNYVFIIIPQSDEHFKGSALKCHDFNEKVLKLKSETNFGNSCKFKDFSRYQGCVET